MLQAMSAQLIDNGGLKLQRCKIVSVAQLMQAQNKFMQPQDQWPLLQAVMQQLTEQLQQLPATQQQQQQQQDEQQQQLDVPRTSNAIAQLAYLLDRSQLQTPEYLAALHQ
jgi:uncharacterized protein (UPF0305 family)